ncbi:hypothetical protein B0H10DRAFT_2023840 [Mycena sp. CBHHK59/15]|nr:hypothetical protein B0H10DRAFT_2023840 [Mycena sp. CBHHK59/15]
MLCQPWVAGFCHLCHALAGLQDPVTCTILSLSCRIQQPNMYGAAITGSSHPHCVCFGLRDPTTDPQLQDLTIWAQL